MRVLILSIILCLSAVAQKYPMPQPQVQYLDQSGQVAAGAKLCTYIANTNTPLATYSNSSGTPNTNPVVLDSAGRASVWLGPQLYKFVLRTGGSAYPAADACTTGTVQWTQDNVSPFSVATPSGSVQYSSGGVLAGSANFTWDNTNNLLTITTPGNQAAIYSNGYIQAGGFLSTANSWQGFNTSTDGALLRGLNVNANAAGTLGGYVNLAPVLYNPYGGGVCHDKWGNIVTQPLPLNGLSGFGAHSAILWVGTSPSMPSDGSCGVPLPVDLDYGLNLNTYMFARGGFATDLLAYNSIQSLEGGMYAVRGFTSDMGIWFKAAATTSGFDTPAAGYGGLAYKGDATYWYYNSTTSSWNTVDFAGGGGGGGITQLTGDVTAGPGSGSVAATLASVVAPATACGDATHTCQLNVDAKGRITSTTSVPISGAGGGAPGGLNTYVQFNNSGAFGGNVNLTWNNASQLLTVNAASSSVAGLAVTTGFAQSDMGFLATTGTANNYNAIQAQTGGVRARNVNAITYMKMGTSAGAPSPTTNDSLSAGMFYWDTGSSSPQVYNGSAWVTMGGGGGSPGGATTNVQFNSTGSFGGSANFTWNNATQLLTVNAASSSVAGLAVTTGFVQSDMGFLATTGTANNYNAIQAQTGGVRARNVNAITYMKMGTNAGAPTPSTNDSLSAGTFYWDTGTNSPQVYNGTSWAAFGGGGGSPGGANTNVQFNSSGSFGGSAYFLWNNSTRLLNIVSSSSSSPGVSVTTGFMQADAGFLATQATATLYNSIQAPGGGMYAKSFTATNYVQSGAYFGTPPVTASDTFQAGALFYDTSAGCEKLYNGSGWYCLGGGVSALNSRQGTVTIAGTTNQINVSTPSQTITLSTPQDIGTSSSVNFYSVTTSSAHYSSATGTSYTFANSNSNFLVNGNGAVSALGAFTSSTGFNVVSSAANNSIQTSGGVNSTNGYYVAGNQIINNLGILSNSFGVDVNAGVAATGFNIHGGATGVTSHTYSMAAPGGGTCTIVVQGGIVVGGSC